MSWLLSTHEEVVSYLRQMEWVNIDEQLKVELLTGGVSNMVWKITTPSKRWVLKQALPKLKVQEEWYSDVDRIFREQLVMRFLQDLIPSDTVPGIIHHDLERHILIMNCAPESTIPWKNQLMEGIFDQSVASNVGRLLKMIHKQSLSMNENQIAQLKDLRFSKQLRIDPFYHYIGQKYAELKNMVQVLVKDLTEVQFCLVHGDFTPKNILVDQDHSLILLDYEVAHWGNPVFDLVSCIAHLLLKGWALEKRTEAVRTVLALLDEYGEQISEKFPCHLGLFLLSRLDGKSPVSYLQDDKLIKEIRMTALNILRGSRKVPLDQFFHEVMGGDSTL
ncbi:5-methylthioribose kinase [Caldalkalibacillus uzonensis]|uniref:5-methylthioribose kinase n=1 Tax=Caldalkalibacillus uzonensis TaxID=353224 RepID=A0ABU0CX27_9BACI|nr:aminoglycoside phosphotransferase family protein [Caldalkalibacillus uzonensis]MDQ0340065.1 5-methylthioribose kinase [Caldalkalibacillus uzonensis]